MKKVFLALSLIGLLGCAEEKVKIPTGLLPPAKLISILADIHIAESRVELMRVSPDTANVIFKKLQTEILKNHKVPEKKFTKTYNYYIENVVELDKIYEGLVDTLGMREIKASAQGNAGAKPANDPTLQEDTRTLTQKERKLQLIDSIRARHTK